MKARTRRPKGAAAPALTDEAVSSVRERRERNIGRQLLRAYRAFNAVATQKLRERGHETLGTTHTALLPHIGLEGTRLTTIAKLAGMTKQAAAEVVQHLEAEGYVERVADPEDRRAVLIMFTPLGWRFLRHASEIKAEIEEEYAAVLGVRGLEDLRRRLTTLVDYYEQRSQED